MVSIRNTGESIVCWRCVPKLDEVALCKRWIKLDRTNGLLLPGEVGTIVLSFISFRFHSNNCLTNVFTI